MPIDANEFEELIDRGTLLIAKLLQGIHPPLRWPSGFLMMMSWRFLENKVRHQRGCRGQVGHRHHHHKENGTTIDNRLGVDKSWPNDRTRDNDWLRGLEEQIKQMMI